VHDPKNTYVIISPPRSASTALARFIWNNPEVRYYSHEPYESVYFENIDVENATAAIENAVDLAPVIGGKDGAGLLIKEISFQARAHFADLVRRTEHPVVFAIRDPRLTVSSRRQVKRLQQQPLTFPLVETGWQDLVEQIDYCVANDVPHAIIDSVDFRSEPATTLAKMLAAWGLPFDESQLSWQPQPEMALSNHRQGGIDHFFTRVLNSAGIEPPTEVVPPLEDFEAEHGLRAHVAWALEQYARLRDARMH